LNRVGNRKAWDYLITFLVAVALALFVRSYIIEAYRIPSNSMNPTLLPGDTLFVAKWPFQSKTLTPPERGEIVVYTAPSESSSTSTSDYIKRIIGLPGDVVAIRQGQVILNGSKLISEKSFRKSCKDERLPNGISYPVCIDATPIQDMAPKTVPPGSVFVIGDFRSSLDTKRHKAWNIIPLSSLKGKALWIWLSIDPQSDSKIPQLRMDRMFRRIR
jgi:signal peptidase I